MSGVCPDVAYVRCNKGGLRTPPFVVSVPTDLTGDDSPGAAPFWHDRIVSPSSPPDDSSREGWPRRPRSGVRRPRRPEDAPDYARGGPETDPYGWSGVRDDGTYPQAEGYGRPRGDLTGGPPPPPPPRRPPVRGPSPPAGPGPPPPAGLRAAGGARGR